MKKIVLIIILCGVGLGAYLVLFNQPPEGPASLADIESEVVLAKETYQELDETQKKVFSKVFEKEDMKTKAFQAFADPNTNGLFYLRDAKLTAKEGKDFLKKAYKNLKECAKEGCDQGPDDEGFYDPANTIAMVSMKRVLEAALVDPELLEVKDWLDQDGLLDLLDAPNSQVRKLALKNLLGNYPSGEVIKSVLDKGKELSGYQAGDTIEELLPYANDDNKEEVINGIIEMIRGKDPLTVTEVLQRVEKLKVGQAQLETIASELCPHKQEEGQRENFMAMAYSINTMAKKSHIRFDLNSYCR